jgi:hypothetical protein
MMGGEDEREGGALLYFNLSQPLAIAGAGREYPSPMTFLEAARRQKGAWVEGLEDLTKGEASQKIDELMAIAA